MWLGSVLVGDGGAEEYNVSRLPKLPHSRHDAASESSSGTATEASKRQFGAVLFPPGKRVLFAVCKAPTLVFFSAADLGFLFARALGFPPPHGTAPAD